MAGYIGQPSEWLSTRPAASITSAPTRPMKMMLVRRMRLNRLPQYHSPATNTDPTATKATLTLLGLIPCISSWLLKPGGGSRTSWKTDWVVHDPSTAFSAIQVGASSQTRDELRIRR